MSSGASCRSQSITTAQSPRACASPAVIAASWPKLRLSRNASHVGVARRRGAAAPPSRRRRCGRRRTRARSCSIIWPDAVRVRRSWSATRHSAQPYTGTTTLSWTSPPPRAPGDSAVIARRLSPQASLRTVRTLCWIRFRLASVYPATDREVQAAVVEAVLARRNRGRARAAVEVGCPLHPQVAAVATDPLDREPGRRSRSTARSWTRARRTRTGPMDAGPRGSRVLPRCARRRRRRSA